MATNEEIRQAIDALAEGVRVNGTASRATEYLINYLTGNIDDIASENDYMQVLTMPAAELARLEATLQDGYECPHKDGYEFDEEVVFDDGVRMAIQVCRPSERGHPCWSQAVLFDDYGREVACLDTSDTLFTEREVAIEHNAATYRVAILPKEEE